jgi:photosystem II stability/assembly factor-like uncharacterized protein
MENQGHMFRTTNISNNNILTNIVLIIILSGNLFFPLHTSNKITYSLKQATEATWEVVDHDYTATFSDVSFINESHGWIVGEITNSSSTYIVILFTNDSGSSWKEQLIEREQLVVQVEVIDELNIWTTGLGCLFHTQDGGKTWTKRFINIANSSTSTVEFYNRTHGWTSTAGILYKTTDGGQTWDTVPGWDFEYDGPRSMVFLSSTDIWAIGWFGIYHSVDGAGTWEEVYNTGGWDLSFVSNNEAWAVRDSGIMHMVDGETWFEVEVPARVPISIRLRPPYLTDVQFVDEDNGWIVGDEVPIMYTPDGGLNWYEQSTSEGVYFRLLAVDFVDQTHGWAVGANGYILRTTRGNTTETRLWGGLTDPVFLSAIGVILTVVVVIFIALWRRRRLKVPKQPSQHSIEL